MLAARGRSLSYSFFSDGSLQVCDLKKCTCRFGTPATGITTPACDENNDEMCMSCEAGYTLMGTQCANPAMSGG